MVSTSLNVGRRYGRRDCGRDHLDKYARKGAYHWVELFGPVYGLNASTMARYNGVVEALGKGGIGPAENVLDVGCGDAALGGLIVRLRARVVGIDTELTIELAKAEFSRRRLRGDFFLVCSNVIEHLGRSMRLAINVAAVPGRNVFSHMGRLRAPSTQIAIAVKPLAQARP